MAFSQVFSQKAQRLDSELKSRVKGLVCGTCTYTPWYRDMCPKPHAQLPSYQFHRPGVLTKTSCLSSQHNFTLGLILMTNVTHQINYLLTESTKTCRWS